MLHDEGRSHRHGSRRRRGGAACVLEAGVEGGIERRIAGGREDGSAKLHREVEIRACVAIAEGPRGRSRGGVDSGATVVDEAPGRRQRGHQPEIARSIGQAGADRDLDDGSRVHAMSPGGRAGGRDVKRRVDRSGGGRRRGIGRGICRDGRGIWHRRGRRICRDGRGICRRRGRRICRDGRGICRRIRRRIGRRIGRRIRRRIRRRIGRGVGDGRLRGGCRGRVDGSHRRDCGRERQDRGDQHDEDPEQGAGAVLDRGSAGHRERSLSPVRAAPRGRFGGWGGLHEPACRRLVEDRLWTSYGRTGAGVGPTCVPAVIVSVGS